MPIKSFVVLCLEFIVSSMKLDNFVNLSGPDGSL